jgi:hypothetical protein
VARAGWAALMSLWQEAAGIQQPKRQSKPGAPVPAAEPHGKPDQALPPLPPTPYEIEEGLHRELPSMPDRVAARAGAIRLPGDIRRAQSQKSTARVP